MKLHKDIFQKDQNIQNSITTILNTLTKVQETITSIQPAKHEQKIQYQDILHRFQNTRGNALYYPYVGSGIGKGALVELTDGSIKYDLISGIGVHIFGHSNKDIIEQCLYGALNDTVMQGNLQQNIEALTVAEKLASHSQLDHCFLTTSGAMACENALKILFHKQYPRSRILAFDNNFCGRTVTLSQITDKPAYRENIPSTVAVDYIPFFDESHPEESTKKAIVALKNHIKRYPKQHACMILELVQGEGGVYVGSSDFFKKIIEILKNENISVWIDEIQTFARTYNLFAFQYFDLNNMVDVVTIGKSSQVCATLFKKSYNPKPGLLSQTFIASSSTLYACNAILEKLTHGKYYGPNGTIQQLHNKFLSYFKQLHQRYPNIVEGPYGIGLMVGCTLFQGDEHKTTKFLHLLFENGVISFLAGKAPTRVRMLLPLDSLADHDIETIFKVFEKTLQQCIEPKSMS